MSDVVRSHHHRSIRAVAGVSAGALLFAGVSAPAGAAGEAVVYVVQGLPTQVVDVAVDGETVASEVETAEVVGP